MTDLTTEVVGFRQWYVSRDLELMSTGLRRVPWAVDVNTAECRAVWPYGALAGTSNPCGSTPARAGLCGCGLYGLHDPSEFWYGRSSGIAVFFDSAHPDPLVSGVITAWGDIQVHWQGFRAQYARVAALALPESPRDRAVVEVVAARYGVPCVPVDQLAQVAREFGDTIPSGLRPKRPGAGNFDGPFVRTPVYRGAWSMWWTTESSDSKPETDQTASPLERIIDARRARGGRRQGPPRPKRAPKRL